MDWIRRHLDPRGRTSRVGFWRLQITFALVVATLMIVTVYLVKAGLSALAMVIFGLPFAALLAAALVVGIRRMHDRGRSGWWAAFFLLMPTALADAAAAMAADRTPTDILLSWPILLMGLALTVWSWLEFGLFRGTRGANRFGPDPAP